MWQSLNFFFFFFFQNVFDSVNKGTDSYISLDEWLDALDRKSLKYVIVFHLYILL